MIIRKKISCTYIVPNKALDFEGCNKESYMVAGQETYDLVGKAGNISADFKIQRYV